MLLARSGGYIGSLQSEFEKREQRYTKTTLYFLVYSPAENPSKRLKDHENRSEIVKLPIDKLIEYIDQQYAVTGLTNYYESAILNKVKKQLTYY